ncbi:hypothetical protein [Desulfatirhabdium butyrativorans]|uniref:hypothetical protein n=1 Tax=Desulfatirhabdium butyrativorans TaxID=340467 RepID=UPI0012EC7B15|nr:hypothetical protein [Desulfatirhabdium butyrativorans]
MSQSESMPEALDTFFSALIEKTKASTDHQVSMTEVGGTIGLDKAASSRAVEELIGLGLVDIRTLSGAVGLTEAGKKLAQERLTPAESYVGIGQGDIVGEAAKEGVGKLLSGIKNCIGTLNLDFDRMNQVVVDLRTLEIQMSAPHPWTAIVRECLKAIAADVGDRLRPELTGRLNRLLA